MKLVTRIAYLAGAAAAVAALTGSGVAAAAQQPITGPLRIAGAAGQTITATYKCHVRPAGAVWGVGNDGRGTIANITPDGSGVYTIKLIHERESVWISNPGGQCASIPVRIVGRGRAAHAAAADSAGVPARIRPLNQWDGEPQFFYNVGWPSNCARMDGAGVLIIGTGDCTAFLGYNVGGSNYEIRYEPGGCLAYNAGTTHFDIATCNSAAPSMLYQTPYPSHQFSEWVNEYSSFCPWADGTGVDNPIYGSSCSGDGDDRWEAVDVQS